MKLKEHTTHGTYFLPTHKDQSRYSFFCQGCRHSWNTIKIIG